jgi:hypothetical protein
MTTYLIEVNEEQRDELDRLVKQDYTSMKESFGGLPLAADWERESKLLHKQIVSAKVKKEP